MQSVQWIWKICQSKDSNCKVFPQMIHFTVLGRIRIQYGSFTDKDVEMAGEQLWIAQRNLILSRL